MKVFADTSALYTLLVANDDTHSQAVRAFDQIETYSAIMLTSSFVLVETMALLQRRVGPAAVRDFNARIIPLTEVIWVDQNWYRRAVERLLAENASQVSLVDCLSFEIMEALNIELAFAFDPNFVGAGFRLVSDGSKK